MQKKILKRIEAEVRGLLGNGVVNLGTTEDGYMVFECNTEVPDLLNSSLLDKVIIDSAISAGCTLQTRHQLETGGFHYFKEVWIVCSIQEKSSDGKRKKVMLNINDPDNFLSCSH